MSLLDDVSIVVTPNAYKAGTLYGVLPTATEGSELVTSWTNKDFASFASSGSNITQMVSSGSGNNNYSAVTITSGKIYKLKFTSSQAITCQIRISANTNLTGASVVLNSLVSGTNEIEFTAPSTYAYIGFYAPGSFTDTQITNFTLKEQTKSDMVVTRATAATRVDENGLVNYAEVLGSEEVTCGDFACSDPNAAWTRVQSTISNGEATITSPDGSYAGIYQNFLTVGKVYSYNIDVTSVTNGVSIFSGSSLSRLITSSGNYQGNFVASNVRLEIKRNGSDIMSATISNVSVKEADLNNVPRIDYTGGGCPHILAEPQRTNIVPYSEDLSQWTLANGTLTPNATVSPDGTQNAGRVVFNNGGLDLKTTVTVVAGQIYTISFYIKLESGAGLQGRFYDNSNGANIEYYTFTSQVQGTQWSRVTRSVTAPSGCTEMQIWLLAASSSLVTASFWGAQFEAGAYLTSYIPTSGSAVTRNQDVFTRDGITSLINSTEGVLFAEVNFGQIDTVARYIGVSNGSTTNRAIFGIEANDSRLYYFFTNGGSGSATLNSLLSDISIFYKIAIKWKLNDFALWVNGVEVGTDALGTTPSAGTFNQLNLTSGGSSQRFNGEIKQLQVYKTALTDNQLIQLTGEAGTHFFESYTEMAEALTYTIQ